MAQFGPSPGPSPGSTPDPVLGRGGPTPGPTRPSCGPTSGPTWAKSWAQNYKNPAQFWAQDLACAGPILGRVGRELGPLPGPWRTSSLVVMVVLSHEDAPPDDKAAPSGCTCVCGAANALSGLSRPATTEHRAFLARVLAKHNVRNMVDLRDMEDAERVVDNTLPSTFPPTEEVALLSSAIKKSCFETHPPVLKRISI